MATIRPRRRKDGSTGYTATIRIKRHGAIVHQESQTFSRRAAAADWARRREVELEDPDTLARAGQGATTLEALIDWYVKEFENVSGWGRSKSASLRQLRGHPIAGRDALSITSAHLVEHIRRRRAAGVGPSTAGNDLTWIGVVLRAAARLRDLPLHPSVVDEARQACRDLRLIARPRKRERRPTEAELQALDAWFRRGDRRGRIPMAEIMWFAVFSARRQTEICKLEWADQNAEDRTGLVRDAKHPRAKAGNHRRFRYTPEAWQIVERQPKGDSRIFPYDAKSVGARFTRACRMLGIRDLRFHDLRHEATSRLFERGYQIHEVAQFTLHESWNELKRYTHLRPGEMREL